MASSSTRCKSSTGSESDWYVTVARKWSASASIEEIVNRRSPRTMRRVASGLRPISRILTATPTEWMSSTPGSSVSGVRCVTTPKIRSPDPAAASIILMYLGRLTDIGATSIGKTTASRSGKRSRTSGRSFVAVSATASSIAACSSGVRIVSDSKVCVIPVLVWPVSSNN